MRVSRPTLSVAGERATVTVGFESEHARFAPSSITMGVPRHLAGRLDLTATPWVPIAGVLAAVLSEDVVLDAPADPVVLDAAVSALDLMASWWGWRTPEVQAAGAMAPDAETGRGHGLFFTRGVDSWASYLELRDTPTERSVTHLLSVFGINPARRPSVEAAIRARTHTVASQLDLELIDIDSNGRVLLDPYLSWEVSHGAALISCGLLLAPVLDRLTIAATWREGDGPPWGSHPDLDERWRTSRVEVVHHLAELDRVQKAAIVARDPLAMDSLHVCWAGGGSTNCGRCAKCLRTMTCFFLVDALDRCPAFASPLTASAVTALVDGGSTLEFPEFVHQLLSHLPADHELAIAWRHHLGGPRDPVIVAPSTMAMAGPSLVARVEAVLSVTPRTTGPVGTEIVLGCEDGMIPLRPPLAERRAVLAAVATNPGRSVAWVMVEPTDPQVSNDPWTAALADRADACWGPGLCYLTGIGWRSEQRPVLGRDSIGRMLDAARVRLWWRTDGTLDPLRLLESVEHGCLPLQVMPGPEAALLRSRLPDELTELVVSIDELGTIDPLSSGHRLDRAVTWMLRGSAERDLSGMAARWPSVAVHG